MNIICQPMLVSLCQCQGNIFEVTKLGDFLEILLFASNLIAQTLTKGPWDIICCG